MAKRKLGKTTGECLGIEFFIDEFFKFVLIKEQVDPDSDEHGEKQFDSYAEMQTYIENQQKTVVANKRVKISEPALIVSDDDDDTLMQVTITGLHSGHGKVITSPKPQGRRRWRDNRLYPDVPIMHDLFKRLRQANYDTAVANAALAMFEFPTQDRDGCGEIEHHGQAVRKLERELKAITAKASKADLQKIIQAAEAEVDKEQKRRHKGGRFGY